MSEQEKEPSRPGDVLEDIITDPNTRGIGITCVGPNLEGADWSMTDGDRETSIALCAKLLKSHIHSLDANDEKFIRDVVSHYNELEVEKSNQKGTRGNTELATIRNGGDDA